MKLDTLIINLEYWAECLENPTYNPLETGFRHSPLTNVEIIQRYKDECHMTRHNILRVIEIIKEEGVE